MIRYFNCDDVIVCSFIQCWNVICCCYLSKMVWFRENWYEEVLRQLRQGLAKCRAAAFENRANVTDTAVTPHTLNFVCKLVSTFGVGVENSVASVVTSTFSSAASESLARRAQATAQDPIFQRIYCWLWFQVGHRNITPVIRVKSTARMNGKK